MKWILTIPFFPFLGSPHAGFPGYDTLMQKDTASVGEIMKQRGWNTFWCGACFTVVVGWVDGRMGRDRFPWPRPSLWVDLSLCVTIHSPHTRQQARTTTCPTGSRHRLDPSISGPTTSALSTSTASSAGTPARCVESGWIGQSVSCNDWKRHADMHITFPRFHTTNPTPVAPGPLRGEQAHRALP